VQIRKRYRKLEREKEEEKEKKKAARSPRYPNDVRRYSLAACSKYHIEHVRLVKHRVPWYSVHENHMHMQRPDRRTQEYPQVPDIRPSARRDNRFASFEEQSYTTRAPREKKEFPIKKYTYQCIGHSTP